MDLTREDIGVVSSRCSWLRLQLHAVVPRSRVRGAALLLHGATLSSFLFDLPVRGCSFQERLAASGWATYALDARGFGRSSRPEPGESGCPREQAFGRAVDGIADLADVISYLRVTRGHEAISLLGFSWGTILAGCFAALQSHALAALILCAPLDASHSAVWMERLADPSDPSRLNREFGAYRWVTADSLRARWDTDIPIDDKQRWRDPRVLDAVLEGALASDPLSATRTPPAFRAPSGPALDLLQVFSGHSLFDAAAIRAPTLLLRGEGDSTATDEVALSLLGRLGSRDKRYEIVAAGGHFQCLERSMPQLVERCANFLGQRWKTRSAV